MLVISEAKRMRQEGHKFEASLGYTLKAGRMTQVVKHLLSKCEALSLKPKYRRGEEQGGGGGRGGERKGRKEEKRKRYYLLRYNSEERSGFT
jgi:hypothetical protein